MQGRAGFGARSDRGGNSGSARRRRTGDARRAGPHRATARLDRPARGQDLPGVLEEDHAIAQQAPALAGMSAHHPGRVPVGGISARTDRLVLTTAAGVSQVAVGASCGAVARLGGGAEGRGWADHAIRHAVRPRDARPRRPLRRTRLHGYQTLRLPVTAVTTTCWLPPRRVFMAGSKFAYSGTFDGRGACPGALDRPQSATESSQREGHIGAKR